MGINKERASFLLLEAFVWLDEGMSIVPAQPRSKVVRIPWRRFEVLPPSKETIKYWFSSGVMNMAVVCGSGGLLVLDFDQAENYIAWYAKAGELANTYTEKTRRGYHLFYKVDDSVNRCFLECQALGLGHLCLVAPSIHPTGAIYFSPDAGNPIRKVKTAELFTLLSDPVKPEPASNPGGPDQVRAVRYSGSDLLSKIKAALPLLSYVSQFTEVKPSNQGQGLYIGRCPLHEDKHPSFWVNSRLDIWGCFASSCPGHTKSHSSMYPRGRDVINLYALIHGLPTSEAIKNLAHEVL